MYFPRLIHSISIEQRDTSTDTFGEQATTYTTFMAAVQAKVSPISGRELMTSGAFDNEISHRVVMRYLAGVTPDMRVNFNGRYLTIKAALNEDERNVKLTLMCAEGLTDA